MRARVSPAAVSHRLPTVRQRTAKVGRGRPFTESPRTTGFKARQENPQRVSVWWRPRDGHGPEVAERAYADLTAELEGAGYTARTSPRNP
ncbi:hypothetical protein RM572_28310 [Streptomyces sp. DSM 42041]|uniref:Uncharacterized protein n=1 Tax=Streptomyces hazeniae TaxID=3075538 RepID=A0ABU2P2I1_9ACTN|nr:hypothetical protein [Streptomyces sp. DSM 42041]MDT0382658.1 hypothetical protein [Streptomyces sp. DSM 42041]